MFKKFFILNRNSETYDFYYPHNLIPATVVEKPFLFPCSDFERYEHGIYVVVLTEITGNKNFITTRFIKDCNFSIAFESDHPWFEIIYSIMNNVLTYKLYLPTNWKSLDKYLADLLLLPHPEPGVVFYIPAADFSVSADKIVVPMKSRQKPFPVFLLSFHKQVQFQDWVVVFESLLLERWIVFHSRHLNRVTNCIFAALELIFPLEWVHLIFPCLPESSINCLGCPSPFIAGVHSCLIDRVVPLLSPGALIVNIDEGTLHFVTASDGSISCSGDMGADTNNGADDIGADPDDGAIPRCLVDLLLRHMHAGHLHDQLNELRAHYVRRGSGAVAVGRNRHDECNADDEEEKNTCKLVATGFLNAIGVLFGKYKSCTQWNPSTSRISINNVAMAQSRGEVLQPFLARVLQSQMVHQFFDDLLNKVSSNRTEATLTFAVDDIDDFEESCQMMSRWQPDHYAEVIANMASRSRRKINDIAVKVRDIARRSPFRSELVHNGQHRPSMPSPPPVMVAQNSAKQSSAPSTSPISLISLPEPTTMSSDVSRSNWITFDDSAANVDVFSGVWEDNLDPLDAVAIVNLDNFDDPDLSPVKGLDKEHSQDGFPVVIRDFDPLYRN